MPVLRILAVVFCCSVFLAGTVPVRASDASEQGPGNAAHILLTQEGTTRKLAIDEIERRLPTVEIEGRASPDEPVTAFQGVLLSDLVRMIGAGEAEILVVRASDGYAADIPRKDWGSWPIVFATRADGAPLTLRKRGPARIIYPVDRYPELAGRTYIDRSVWLITEIEW
ncbi:hypothetical protein [Stappia sp. ES.058]|uniref:hypothetical protein n=1 Tax=Stappia sp. ES.058 TaxID=1881061 RepID=UPI00087A1496|nr:hypothetical protein [Stappia sp. ES.058]SDU35775.1 hypothetical protein SAMN05428979_3201 [Stappia sp. ES.058]